MSNGWTIAELLSQVETLKSVIEIQKGVRRQQEGKNKAALAESQAEVVRLRAEKHYERIDTRSISREMMFIFVPNRFQANQDVEYHSKVEAILEKYGCLPPQQSSPPACEGEWVALPWYRCPICGDRMQQPFNCFKHHALVDAKQETAAPKPAAGGEEDEERLTDEQIERLMRQCTDNALEADAANQRADEATERIAVLNHELCEARKDAREWRQCFENLKAAPAFPADAPLADVIETAGNLSLLVSELTTRLMSAEAAHSAELSRLQDVERAYQEDQDRQYREIANITPSNEELLRIAEENERRRKERRDKAHELYGHMTVPELQEYYKKCTWDEEGAVSIVHDEKALAHSAELDALRADKDALMAAWLPVRDSGYLGWCLDRLEERSDDLAEMAKLRIGNLIEELDAIAAKEDKPNG